ncbi:tail protein [Streptomyces sp. Ag109_G2-6]|uniref:phage tail family protein n=1 Tax=Streptomyces sp. Ag109_G2-6 TaxID=2485154 RepID=UPI000F9BF999|nr:phage tail family protein [Streptomyces sp. Ag109_G2-6]RPF45747.1 tail protein [Streptomyces sp. Ag109_G2-6]
MKLELSSPSDRLDLAGFETDGVGFQALAGITGLGLPQLSVQWLEGAGDGAAYRGRRVLPRDIDIPLDIVGRNRAHLAELVTRLARVLADECTLTYIDDAGVRWSTPVRWIGGGSIDPGAGNRDVQTVITLRAPSPYFLADSAQTVTIGGTTAAPFLSAMSSMPLSSSQAIGSAELTNDGDVAAYPVFQVYGPGDNFKAIGPGGETLWYTGSITSTGSITVDMGTGVVRDGSGANVYRYLSTAPRFWSIPPGTSTISVSLLNTTTASRIVVSWRPRKWVVI